MFAWTHKLEELSILILLLWRASYPMAHTPTAQSRVHPVLQDRVYQKTLDLLFSEGEPLVRNDGIVTVLRFEPSFAPESEIILRETAESSELLCYRASEGNLYQKLSELVQSGVAQDPESLARKVSVSKTKISVPGTLLKKWNSDMFEAIRLSTKMLEESAEQEREGTASFPLDGTVYVFKYYQGTTDLSIKLYDADIGQKKVSPQFKLVQWMNSVLEYASSRRSPESH